MKPQLPFLVDRYSTRARRMCKLCHGHIPRLQDMAHMGYASRYLYHAHPLFRRFVLSLCRCVYLQRAPVPPVAVKKQRSGHSIYRAIAKTNQLVISTQGTFWSHMHGHSVSVEIFNIFARRPSICGRTQGETRPFQQKRGQRIFRRTRAHIRNHVFQHLRPDKPCPNVIF